MKVQDVGDTDVRCPYCGAPPKASCFTTANLAHSIETIDMPARDYWGRPTVHVARRKAAMAHMGAVTA